MGIIEGKSGKELFEKYKEVLATVTPREIMEVFHKVVEEGYPIEDIKKGVNKILHTVYIPLKNYKIAFYSENSAIDLMIKDNKEMEKRLNAIKPLIKSLNKGEDKNTPVLKERFSELSRFSLHYTVKENTIFPLLEKKSEYFKCTRIMWSFDDDIRKNLKKINSLLENNFSLKEFNLLSGKLFFDMFAISFRENRILFPYFLEIAEEGEINSILKEIRETKLPFVNTEKITKSQQLTENKKDINKANLNTGTLTPEQIALIFNHLPVDITFVDENNEVKFFSTPKERIFPRTKSVLGRKVQNCHPPESIDTVNRIVESFKKGGKTGPTSG